ncbi:hypothetical protein VNO78_20880 [Psophocarpus tetragonolobus]|uniref:CCHC-type domain-containing protein n=1 Tax=Psophocarpus tetragonolobus TaxID=3891 RepID=A0AAN9SAR5_PSOTE
MKLHFRSPDEAAFVLAAREFGFEFFHKNTNKHIIALHVLNYESGKKVDRVSPLPGLLQNASSSIVLCTSDYILLCCHVGGVSERFGKVCRLLLALQICNIASITLVRGLGYKISDFRLWWKQNNVEEFSEFSHDKHAMELCIYAVGNNTEVDLYVEHLSVNEPKFLLDEELLTSINDGGAKAGVEDGLDAREKNVSNAEMNVGVETEVDEECVETSKDGKVNVETSKCGKSAAVSESSDESFNPSNFEDSLVDMDLTNKDDSVREMDDLGCVNNPVISIDVPNFDASEHDSEEDYLTEELDSGIESESHFNSNGKLRNKPLIPKKLITTEADEGSSRTMLRKARQTAIKIIDELGLMPPIHMDPGTPKKLRKREVDEGYSRTKMRKTKICRTCGETGHNKRTCKKAAVDEVETEIALDGQQPIAQFTPTQQFGTTVKETCVSQSATLDAPISATLAAPQSPTLATTAAASNCAKPAAECTSKSKGVAEKSKGKAHKNSIELVEAYKACVDAYVMTDVLVK